MSSELLSSTRLKLSYEDELPKNLDIKKLTDFLNEYDCDIVTSILERGCDIDNEKMTYTNPDPNVKNIYIDNAYEVTYAHALLLLNKFPNSEIVLFVTKESTKPPIISIVDTHFNNSQTALKKRKLEKKEYINAAKLMEEYRKEIGSLRV
jgi:hypothetical protein